MGAAPPKAATDYDVVAIGSGVGGYSTLWQHAFARHAGRRRELSPAELT
jgi:hypothetical protein